MQSISFDEIIQGGVVRVKDGDLPLISVIDVIKVVTGKNNDDSGKTFRRICENVAVRSKCPDWQFPGERQRDTPVADLDTILIILQHLPGPSAQKYREMVAVKLRNAIAAQNNNDDLTHIAKKTKNVKGDSFHVPEGQKNDALKTNTVPEINNENTLVENSIENQAKRMEVELSISKLKKQKASIDLEIVFMVKDAFISLSPDQTLCPTATNLLKDQVANIVKVCGVNPNQPRTITSIDNTQTFQESPFHPITISDRVHMLGYNFDKNMLLKAGQIISSEYKKLHGKGPMKDKRMVDGAFRDINVYTNEDIPILDSAIQRVFQEIKKWQSQAQIDAYMQNS